MPTIHETEIIRSFLVQDRKPLTPLPEFDLSEQAAIFLACLEEDKAKRTVTDPTRDESLLQAV